LSDVTEVVKAVPFLRKLMGLTYIGHGVWVFEGHATTSVVDGTTLPTLPLQLAITRKAAEGKDLLAFPN